MSELPPEESSKRNADADKTRQYLHKKAQTPSDRIVFGIVASLTLTIAILIIFFLVSLLFGFQMNIFMILGAISVSFGMLFFSGFQNIPIGSMAILKLFGKRTNTLLDEGDIWLLKPIQSLEEVDLREHTTEIRDKEFISMVSAETEEKANKEAADNNTETEVRSEEEKTSGQKTKKEEAEKKEDAKTVTERAMMKVSAAIQWMVKDPWKFKDTGPSVVEEGLRYVIISSTREMAVQHAPLDFLKLKSELGRSIDEAAITQSERWGIEILNVNVTRIEFANKEIEAAAEKRLKERVEKDAEEFEMRHAIKMVKLVADETEMSPEDAATFVHRERNKFSHATDLHFSGNKVSDLMGLMGMRAAETQNIQSEPKDEESPSEPKKNHKKKGGKQ